MLINPRFEIYRHTEGNTGEVHLITSLPLKWLIAVTGSVLAATGQ